MSERINWEKLINKHIGRFNPHAKQYFNNNQDHFQFLALVKVKYEKQSILTVTEFKKNFYDACQQRIGQFEIDNERAKHFGCLISITFIQLFICKKNNFKLDKNINEILKQKKYNHHLWKKGKKYDLKHLNEIISVFDRFYSDDRREQNPEERRIMFSFKNEEYLSLKTESDKSNYDTKIYNKYFKSYVEDKPEENYEDSSDEELDEELHNQSTLEKEENQNNEKSEGEESEVEESEDEESIEINNEEPTESDDDFIVDDNHIEYESELIDELKEENNDLVTENEDLIQNNEVLKRNLNTLEQTEKNNKRKIAEFTKENNSLVTENEKLIQNNKVLKRNLNRLEQTERNNKRKISVLEDNESKYISRISQLEEIEKFYFQLKKHHKKIVSGLDDFESKLHDAKINEKNRIQSLNNTNDELENKNHELENKIFKLLNKIDLLQNKKNELEIKNNYLEEENENLRKKLKIEGQYSNYWLGGKSKEYTPFLNWPKDEDL